MGITGGFSPEDRWQFPVDYRKLSERIKKDSYPIPRMDDCIVTLGESHVFTSLEANSGYCQVNIREEDKNRTAFTSQEGFYEFNRMPFGLKNAPATFQLVLDIVLERHKWQTFLAYIDDEMIYSATIAQHICDVDRILEEIARDGMNSG